MGINSDEFVPAADYQRRGWCQQRTPLLTTPSQTSWTSSTGITMTGVVSTVASSWPPSLPSSVGDAAQRPQGDAAQRAVTQAVAPASHPHRGIAAELAPLRRAHLAAEKEWRDAEWARAWSRAPMMTATSMQHGFQLGAAEAIPYDLQYFHGVQTPGSKEHPENCTPCAFVWKPHGCGNGAACPFCHICDTREKKKRQKERRRVLKETGTREVHDVNPEALMFIPGPELALQ